MIITDSTPHSPLKGAPPQIPQIQPPPLYQATQTQETRPLYTPVLVRPPLHRQSARGRFLRTFLVAVLIWCLIGIAVRSVVELAYWNHRHGNWMNQISWPGDYAIPLGIHTGDCTAHWDEIPPRNPSNFFPFHATTSFEVPYDSNTLLFLARGSSPGEFAVVVSDQVSDVARVQVVVSYHRDFARDRAKVCYIERKNGAAGVGIFTPSSWNYPSTPREDQLKFTVVVSLPASSSGKALPIKNFEADMPLFSISAVHLEEAVYFHKISLITSNMPIGAESILADDAFIKTSNAPIAGSFNTSSSLKLITSNAPIKADVGLTNDDERTTQVLLKSSNGLIHASISLLRDDHSNAGGKYNVSAITSNSGLQIDFPTSPVDSTLTLEAATSNAGATVSLHPAFEGQFALRSSIFRPDVEKSLATDPSGRGRRRTVEYDSYTRGLVSGKVKWTGSTKRDGKVFVKSSNARILLKL